MRIALVHEDVRTSRRTATLARLLARPVDGLAEDLAVLGHVVDEVRIGSPSRYLRVDPASDARPSDATGRGTRRHDTAPGRELSVLRSLSPDAVLAVGAGAARVVDDLSAALQVPWVWSPGGQRCLDTDGERWVPASAARIVVASPAERDAFARAGVPRESCDLSAWHLATRDREMRPVGDCLPRVRTVLAAADADGEGVADVVRSLALLTGMRAVVAVDPATARDRRSLQRWVRLARGLGVSDRVHLVQVGSRADVIAVLRAADMVVSVPHGCAQEELIAAAMWCGVPVVASDIDDARHLVDTGCTGLVLPPADVRRLARALEVVREDASSRRLWVLAARRRAVELLSPSVTARAVARSLEVPQADVVRPSARASRRASVFGRAATG